MKILFMGTPEFARVSLSALIGRYGAGSIAAVLCQPDKPVGRKQLLTAPPTKIEATSHGIAVLQPSTLRTAEITDTLRGFDADIFVVVAYGKILPREILAIPRLGCVNLHGSLLPKYRGAAPIQAAIMAGESVVGVNTMRMDEGMDTGDILLGASTPLLDDDNYGMVHDKLAALGAELLVRTIDGLAEGTIIPTPQNHENATYAPKIVNETCRIDWNRPARDVRNHIRALSPAPLAETLLAGRRVKVTGVAVEREDGSLGTPGDIISTSGGKIIIACKEGAVSILSLVPEGKREMSAAAYLNGHWRGG